MAFQEIDFNGRTVNAPVNDQVPAASGQFLNPDDSGVRKLLGPELASFYVPPGQEVSASWVRRNAKALGLTVLAVIIGAGWYLTVIH